MIHRCKEHGRTWCVRCVLITVGFPLEHFVWEKTPLRIVTAMLGLH